MSPNLATAPKKPLGDLDLTLLLHLSLRLGCFIFQLGRHSVTILVLVGDAQSSEMQRFVFCNNRAPPVFHANIDGPFRPPIAGMVSHSRVCDSQRANILWV